MRKRLAVEVAATEDEEASKKREVRCGPAFRGWRTRGWGGGGGGDCGRAPACPLAHTSCRAAAPDLSPPMFWRLQRSRTSHHRHATAALFAWPCAGHLPPTPNPTP